MEAARKMGAAGMIGRDWGTISLPPYRPAPAGAGLGLSLLPNRSVPRTKRVQDCWVEVGLNKKEKKVSRDSPKWE